MQLAALHKLSNSQLLALGAEAGITAPANTTDAGGRVKFTDGDKARKAFVAAIFEAKQKKALETNPASVHAGDLTPPGPTPGDAEDPALHEEIGSEGQEAGDSPAPASPVLTEEDVRRIVREELGDTIKDLGKDITRWQEMIEEKADAAIDAVKKLGGKVEIKKDATLHGKVSDLRKK